MLRKRLIIRYAAFLIVLAATAPTGPVAAAETTLRIGNQVRVSVPVRTFKDRRDAGVVKQSLDYSCGAGALATLLKYDLDEPVSEADVIDAVLAGMSVEDVQAREKTGLSLLDLQRVAEGRGLRAQGFRLAPEHLAKLRSPVLVFIKPRGYEHFAVLRGLRGDRVHLADPSRGNLRMAWSSFLEMWTGEDGLGIIFVVERSDGAAPGTGDFPWLSGPAEPRPETLSARQMLEVGNPSVRFSDLGR